MFDTEAGYTYSTSLTQMAPSVSHSDTRKITDLFKAYGDSNNPLVTMLDKKDWDPEPALEEFIESEGRFPFQAYELFFHLEDNPDHSRITDPVGISGTGDQFRVFATVADFVRKEIKRNKIDILHFSAKEKSRKKLYDTFSKMIAREMKTKVLTTVDKGETIYWFVI